MLVLGGGGGRGGGSEQSGTGEIMGAEEKMR